MTCLCSSQSKTWSTYGGDEQEQDLQKRVRQYSNWREFTLGKKKIFNDLFCRYEGWADIIHSFDQRQPGEFSKIFCQLLQHQGVPDIHVDTFSVDPLEYHYFMKVSMKQFSGK